MKIYISLPISGRNIKDVEAACIFAAKMIERAGHTAVSPLDICAGIDPDDYPALMGRCITELLRCDAMLIDPDWHSSKGCRLEHQASIIYDKPIYKHISQILNYDAI